MIDKVIVMNIPERTDRKWFMYGHLATIGVAYPLIEVFPARNASHYTNIADVLADAHSDGFHFFADWENARQDEIKHAVIIWNWCAILRRIIDSGHTSLVLLDDRVITVRFNELCGLVSICRVHCMNKPYSFYALQLQHTLCDFNNDEPIEYELQCKAFGPHGNMNLIQGFAGNGDYATVFSPQGADHLLELVADRPFVGLERLFYEQRPASRTTGFYSYVGNRNGIVHDYGREIDEELR